MVVESEPEPEGDPDAIPINAMTQKLEATYRAVAKWREKWPVVILRGLAHGEDELSRVEESALSALGVLPQPLINGLATLCNIWDKPQLFLNV